MSAAQEALEQPFTFDEHAEYHADAQWAVHQALTGPGDQRIVHALVAIASAMLAAHQQLDFIGDQLEAIARR